MTTKRNKTPLSFFGITEQKGGKETIDPSSISPQRFYKGHNGELWLGDSIEWLRSLDSGSIDLIFADPPYNIKKADWDTFESQEIYIAWSMEWVKEAARVLKPTGTLYICGFSEILADQHEYVRI